MHNETDNPPTESPIESPDLYTEIRAKVVLVSRSHYWVHTSLFAGAPEPHIWREMTPSQFFNLISAAKGMKKSDVQTIVSRLLMDSASMIVKPSLDLPRYPLHPAGYQHINDEPYFIAKDWLPVAAVEGDPTPVIRLVLRMFRHEADLMLGWLQGAYMRQLNYAAEARGEAPLYPPYASQTLCISGEQGTGKSQFLLRSVIAPLLGEVSAIPTAWLTAKTHFTDWMLDHLVYLSDDSSPLLSIKDRKAAATALKNLGYASRKVCECKGKGAVTVDFPNERVFLTNMAQDSLRALPDFSDDGDKFLVLHNAAPAGFEEDYAGDPRRMQEALLAAIPAFAHWLLNDYTIPAWAVGTQGNRHAVMNLGANRGYISPVIMAAVAELDAAGIFMSKLRRITMGYESERNYCGKWLPLTKVREALESTEHGHAEYATDQELGRLLTECAERWPHLVIKKRFKQGWHYWLAQRAKWLNALSTSTENTHGAVLNPDLLTLVNMTADDLAAADDVDDDPNLPDLSDALNLA